MEVRLTINDDLIRDLLRAFHQAPPSVNHWVAEVALFGESQAGASPASVFAALPLSDQGHVELCVLNTDGHTMTFRLDREAIAKGLAAFAGQPAPGRKRVPARHYARWLDGGADEVTADAFMQCCVFGELVYG